MSTSKILKNKQPHQVKVREGSKDAQRKAVKIPEEKPVAVPSIQRKVKAIAEPAKASKPVKTAPKTTAAKSRKQVKPVNTIAPVAAVVPASIAKKVRSKAPPKVQEKADAVDPSPKPTVTAPPSVARVVLPEHELWETDSPVMRRISLLRTRNAQLSEQVQRLKKPA